MICQVRGADVIQFNNPVGRLFGNRGLLLIAPSLHALIENPPLFARTCKGGLTLALRQVAVTIFNLTLGSIAQS